MRKNSITFLISSLGDGGAEGVCVNLANNLSNRGWQVTLVVLHLNSAVRRKDLNADVELMLLNKRHARTAVVGLWKFLQRRKPDKVLVFNHQLAVLLVFLRKFSGFRFKIIARNISTLSQKKLLETSFWHKRVVQGITKMFYRRVDQIIAQSIGMANDLVDSYLIPRNIVEIIHNPISEKIEQYFLPQKMVKDDYLLCVGRLEKVKAFHQAINAFAAVATDYPHLRLKLVGRGSLESELKRQARALGVADRVDFEGFQTEMIPYYLRAKATLLTSLYEGFPNVLVESIAMGTPVVAFNCPSGPSEIVMDGVNGFLVPYKDENALVVAICKVMDMDWPLSQVAGSSEKFRLGKILEKYENVLMR
ncbi:glycosyltransferase [Alkalispirochaeta alkalica]|uniref:glycosyltransferase n=1 Tax=Alkalispirochaeta alkalica TaxID=46356 RepID=UPI0003A05CE9|nr:glycosyltransferase [Alkalispirochaeta alkalica]